MTIQTRAEGPVLIITIVRPEAMNALDITAMVALRRELEQFRDDTDHSVAILTGDGDRAFCTGADLKNTMPPTTPFVAGYFEPGDRSIESGVYTRAISIDDMGITKPIIAAVNGHALGGGLEIALACDLRVGSTNATFGLPEVRWASMPALGGLTRLLRSIPPAVAMKMLLTADRISADEAHRIGLISDLVAPADLLPTAIEIARKIDKNGPLAVKAVKLAARNAVNMSMSDAVATEQLLWGLLRDTADRREGREAFIEKRDPLFRGE